MTQQPQQSGFTASRSTIDAILALRLLSELHRQFNCPLYVAFVDIKSAFEFSIQLTEMLSGKLYVPKEYQTFF